MSTTVFRHGNVFDGTGSMPVQADVAISEGRITAVGENLRGDEEVDITGSTLLPGLIDCHVHLTMSDLDTMTGLERPFSYPFYQAIHNMAATLDCGITTVRDAGGTDAGMQLAVEDGLIEGPRMQIAVSILSQTGGHSDGWMPSGFEIGHQIPHPGRPSGIVDGPEEMRRKVRELVRVGAQVIKVCTSGGVLSPRDDPRHAHFRDDELAALVAEATAAGRGVMAHAQSTDGIKNAVRAGIRSIEHGIYLDDEAISMMIEAGTWLVPTLSAPQAVLNAVAGGAKIPAESLRKARDVIAAHLDSFARAVNAGVKVAMGTDTGVGPHGANLDELAMMEAGGMTPQQVLAASTSSAADLLGMGDDVGTLAPGKLADMVVVSGDPFDLSAFKSNIASVYKGGVKVRG
ncbi:amidohydrolase family protein [Paenarthrobacter sp. Z7-10]|uniref:metal-dependent hydrolase family protein n=1 Tax=Paenarthrobacter sp. Z7-10 TaxID=2787635 RepID=UPI0022A923A0|nr:amidohydrolase family protein [Paenarthrobacter sp. Z7-10]MCZ2401619.1 amidohydrolase family protein [Paenarthrobacter sp. Z7-10]